MQIKKKKEGKHHSSEEKTAVWLRRAKTKKFAQIAISKDSHHSLNSAERLRKKKRAHAGE